MTIPPSPPPQQSLEMVLSRLEALAAQHRRRDVRPRLEAARKLLTNETVRAVVVGQFKQGKSALVNAIVDAPICPVDDVVATSVPTVVQWGEQTSAAVVTEISRDHEALRTSIDPALLRQHVTDLAGEIGLIGSVRAEVSLPRPILAAGFTFIDTPGAGRAQARTSTNLTLLPQADVAIMVTDATQELTEPEIAFLKQASLLCERIICVISKTDMQQRWRDIVVVNADHLRNANLDVPLFATSALLRSLAEHHSEPAWRTESRIDEVTAYLQKDVKAAVRTSRRRLAARELLAAIQLIDIDLQSQLRALTSNNDGQTVIRELQSSESQARQLMEKSARWQLTLSDGAGDLVTDTEFDLRDRLRSVGRDAEELIDSCDPGKSWDSIGDWLADSITQAVSDNFVWAHQRSEHLADLVAQHFAVEGRAAVPDLTIGDIDSAVGGLVGPDTVNPGSLSMGQKFMIGLKGSYGGVLMFGLMTTVAGMALVNPISLAAGVVMGGFAYRNDSRQRLEQRRAEARTAVRKLIDETIFQVSKNARDQTSVVKRQLRDHFIDIADDLKKSFHTAAANAKNVAALPPTEREPMADKLTREIRNLTALRAIATADADGTPHDETIGSRYAA